VSKRQGLDRWQRALILGAVSAMVLVVPASAGGAQVTRGDFNEFSDVAMDISGHAVMVRTADGRTIVSIHVVGLTSGLVYGSHVHLLACNDNKAGTHYKFDPSGASTPPNEIWPGPFTANDAGIGNGNTTADGIAGDTARSVVIHAPGGAKLACADLE
jgi:hypothetical protein